MSGFLSRFSQSNEEANGHQVVPRPVADELAGCETILSGRGSVIVNADDWGRDTENTDRILECALRESVSSARAMVFLEDSERAAHLARLHGMDVGLHLNLTTPFLPSLCPPRVVEHQAKIIHFLRSHRLSRVVYHPGLASSFDYVVHAQLEEFQRLYGEPANRIDGHHHMHLCANVVHQKVIPAGTIVRRNFSFWPGEKNFANRIYRQWQDRMIARRHRVADYLFSLPQLKSRERLERVLKLAGNFNVEIETHPVNRDEYNALVNGEIKSLLGKARIVRGYRLCCKDAVENVDTMV